MTSTVPRTGAVPAGTAAVAAARADAAAAAAPGGVGPHPGRRAAVATYGLGLVTALLVAGGFALGARTRPTCTTG